jgi:RNA polymerase sigma factor (sigma-70 family)
MNLESLTERARAGDTQALEQLVRETVPDLRRFANRVCRTGADAEDAVQQALFRLTIQIRGLRTVSRLTSWAFTIVRNECTRAIKLATRVLRGDERVSARPDDVVEQREFLEQLVAAMGALPDSLRAVFVLRELEHRDTAECAQRLGISEANVKVRLHRAREFLRLSLTAPLS